MMKFTESECQLLPASCKVRNGIAAGVPSVSSPERWRAMKIEEIMTKEVTTVAPETPFKDVIDRLVRCEVSGLPVVDGNGKLVGLVTEADVIPKEAFSGRRHRALALLGDVLSGRDHGWVEKARGSTAADVMTKNVTTCRRNDDARSVARRMLELDIKRMPVVEAGEVVGIVSRHDILSEFDRPDEAILADVKIALTHDPNLPDDQHVQCSVDDGIVSLTGDVRYGWDEAIVVSIVRGVPGVIDVVSHIHAREANPRSSMGMWTFVPRVPR